jgi:RNA polymerase-interacting CarD/CdnL/TRCF family regulator
MRVVKASTSRKKKTSKKSQRTPAKKKASKGRRTGAGKTARSRKTSKKGKSMSRGGAAGKAKKGAARKPSTKSSRKRTGTTRRKAKKAVRKAAGKKTAARKKAVRKAPKKTARETATKKKAGKKKAAGKTSATTAKTATKKAAGMSAAKASAKKATLAVMGKKTHERAHEAPVKKPPRPAYGEILARLPYREGSFVVHPKYGLGKVDRVVERRLSTGVVPCMEIGFPYQEMKLTIPVDQVERSGLRQPIGKREINDVFRVLKGRATFDAKRRSAKRVVDYRKRLSQGDPTSLAEAVRDLARLSLRKSLSYEERKILSTALRILSREVALARGREADDVREEIENIVYR